MELGCAGFVDKTAANSELVNAIRAVHAGRRVVSIPKRAAAYNFPNTPAAVVPHLAAQNDLSEREREVLIRIARGLTNQQAADELFLSIKTVETYRSRLTRKLGLNGRSELYDYARSIGILS